MDVTASKEPTAPPAGDPLLVAAHLAADTGGTTSLRFVSDRQIDENKYPPNSVTVFGRYDRLQPQRDRDLGQTFRTGNRPVRLGALHLRVGPSDRAVLPGAPGARVAIQFFEVTGQPRINDHGTPGRSDRFDRQTSPELDDFLEGETYTPIALFVGRLPEKLERGDYLKFIFTGNDRILLQPERTYAFLLMFTERGPGRSMSLANRYFGSYQPDPANPLAGHGIRREGRPVLPDDLRERLRQPPGTLGFPDVCTFRDLYFAVTAAPADGK